jgi:hypothetical protein
LYLKNVSKQFQFFFLNLSSKFPAGVRVRMSKYLYMDMCDLTFSGKSRVFTAVRVKEE